MKFRSCNERKTVLNSYSFKSTTHFLFIISYGFQPYIERYLVLDKIACRAIFSFLSQVGCCDPQHQFSLSQKIYLLGGSPLKPQSSARRNVIILWIKEKRKRVQLFPFSLTFSKFNYRDFY